MCKSSALCDVLVMLQWSESHICLQSDHQSVFYWSLRDAVRCCDRFWIMYEVACFCRRPFLKCHLLMNNWLSSVLAQLRVYSDSQCSYFLLFLCNVVCTVQQHHVLIDWLVMRCYHVGHDMHSTHFSSYCRIACETYYCIYSCVCLWLPCGIGQAIIFLPCSFYLSSSSSVFFPPLISAVGGWMSAILPHMVWP